MNQKQLNTLLSIIILLIIIYTNTKHQIKNKESFYYIDSNNEKHEVFINTSPDCFGERFLSLQKVKDSIFFSIYTK